MPDRNKILRSGDAIVVLPGKSPDEIFLMVLCLVTAIPIIFGKAPAPGSIDSKLEPWLVFWWSVVLALGAAIVLVSFMLNDRVTGIIVEQFGSICLGVAAAIYALVIFRYQLTTGGAVPGSIIMGFAVARFIQAWQHQKTLKKIRMVLAKIQEGEVHGH